MASKPIKTCVQCGSTLDRYQTKYCTVSCKNNALVKVIAEGDEKTCTKCGKSKPFSDFNKGNDRFGKSHICRACDKQKGRLYHQGNRVARKEYHERNKDERNTRTRKWKELHPDYNKRYYEKDAAYHKQRVRKWQIENPEKAVANNHARRARKASATGRYTASDRNTAGVMVSTTVQPNGVQYPLVYAGRRGDIVRRNVSATR